MDTDSGDQESGKSVSDRAYAIWVEEGRPHGCDADHWARAEQELAQGEGELAADEVPVRKVRAPRKAKPKA